MENEILNEEEMNVLTLTDEDGVETEFEYLDVIEYVACQVPEWIDLNTSLIHNIS